jgi:hypothetical protein
VETRHSRRPKNYAGMELRAKENGEGEKEKIWDCLHCTEALRGEDRENCPTEQTTTVTSAISDMIARGAGEKAN